MPKASNELTHAFKYFISVSGSGLRSSVDCEAASRFELECDAFAGDRKRIISVTKSGLSFLEFSMASEIAFFVSRKT